MAARHAFEHVVEVGEGVDVVELGGGNEGANRGPAVGTPVGSGKQMVLASQRDGSDRALNRVGVELNAAVTKEGLDGDIATCAQEAAVQP